MKRYSFALDLLLQSPMHITAIEPGRYSARSGRLVRGSDDQNLGIPCALTRVMDVARAAPKLVRREDDSELLLHNVQVPVIPANTLSGRFRRMGAALIIDSLIQRDLKISARAYNTLSAGTADASFNRSLLNVEMIAAATRDAYLSVFGGTSFALSRHLTVAEGFPVTPDTIPLLMIPPQTANPYASDFLTGVVHITKKDDVFDLRDPERLERAIGLVPVSGYLTDIMAGRAGKKSRKETDAADASKKTELSANTCLEVVRPGMSFAVRVGLNAYDDAQLGLAMLCLQRFANMGQIGGRAVWEYGRFSVTSARMFTYEGFARSESGIDLWQRTTRGDYQFADEPFIQRAVHAGQDYVDQIDPKFIEAYASADPNAFKARAA